MATQQNFDGKIIKLPGVYSNVLSGIKSIPATVAYGDLIIFDTGSGAGSGGGAGISGTITTDGDSVYEFDNIEDFRRFCEKGPWWLLAQPLFKPLDENGQTLPGVSKITYIKCAATTPAVMRYSPTGIDSSDSAGGGDIYIQVRNEGLVGNGVLNSNDVLSRGYAFKVKAGVRDTAKFIMEFYRGVYKGIEPINNLPYDFVTEENVKAELVCQSKEYSNAGELINWMLTNQKFNESFRYDGDASDANLTDTIGAGDLTAYADYTLASGGTESYSDNDLTQALLIAKNIPADFVLCDKWGSNSTHANNLTIIDWAVNEAKFRPQVYFASGSTKSEFAISKADAVETDNQAVSCVHGGPKISSRRNGTGFNLYDSIYKAANLLGREAGVPAQVPLTFKAISINGERHPLNENEKIEALDSGLLVTHNESGRFEVLKGVNTLQDNEEMLNPDGKTHSKQLYRIAHQLNKGLIITAKRELLNDPNGVNRNTLSALDVQQWTKGYLEKQKAIPTADNLILSYRDVIVTRVADGYKIGYGFESNTEISFLMFTGLMLDVN